MNSKEKTTREPSNKSLKIYQKYLELIYYSNDIVRKYPKCENFSLVKEIKNSLYIGLRNLMYAIKCYNKNDKLKYLNELDQYIKRALKIKYYTRYMDDFVLLLKSKKECIDIKKKIEDFLAQNLKLELNAKSRYSPYKMGVNFCGYRIFTTHRLLRLSSKKKIKKNVKKWNKQYTKGILNFNYTMQSINSWIGHASHCNSYQLQKKVLDCCDFLFTNSTYLHLENNLLEDMQNFTIK